MQHQLTITHKRAGNSLGATITEISTGEVNFEEAFASDASDYSIPCSIDVSAMKMLFIMATADATLEWNDGAGSQGSLTLKANEPEIWHADSNHDNPLGAVDVTGFFVTADDSTAGTIYLYCLHDQTP